MNERRNVPEIVIVICELLRRSQTRINLLFTMSEIPHARPVKDATCEVIFRGRCLGDQSVDQWSTRLRSFELRRARFDRHARLRHAWPKAKRGGARRDRTDDLMLAKHALSQLSYGPVPEDECFFTRSPSLALRRSSLRSRRPAEPKLQSSEGWWAWEDLNFRPHAYQARALTN